MPPLARTAVVGCGTWGRNVVRSFHELGALAAVVDPDEATARALGERYGVPILSFAQMLDDSGIEAVATASPAPLHRDIAVAALERGKHVLVEKPIALTPEDGRAMREASRRAGRTLMVGHLLRYHPAFLRLHALVADGVIGKLRTVSSHRLSMGKLRTEEDVVWSFAPHDISMILALAGERPTHVERRSASVVSANLADSAHLHLDFASGLGAHVFVSWISPFKEQRLVAIGERGSLVFDDTKPWSEKLVLTEHSVKEGPTLVKGHVEAIPVEEAPPLLEECRHFLDCVRTGERPRTDADEALAVLDVLVRA